MQVVTKGFEFDYAKESLDWTETSNYKDFDIVFINLPSLLDEGMIGHPAESKPNSLKMPPTSDIAQVTRNNGHVFVIIPPEPEVTVNTDKHSSNSLVDLDIFYWLPINPIFDLRGGSSIKRKTWDWKWYFDGNFDYPMYLGAVESEPITREWVPDPEEGYILNKSGAELSTKVDQLAVNPADEPVAAKIQLFTEREVEISQKRNRSLPDFSGGYILSH